MDKPRIVCVHVHERSTAVFHPIGNYLSSMLSSNINNLKCKALDKVSLEVSIEWHKHLKDDNMQDV